jgi:hypothetical protein
MHLPGSMLRFVRVKASARLPPMGFSKRMMAKERAAALRAEAERLRQLRGPEISEAEELVRRWNRRVARGGWPPYYPTIGAALLAGTPILDFVCPACRICGQVDLRTRDRHPQATIGILIPQLSCTRCVPNPPFARLLVLRCCEN